MQNSIVSLSNDLAKLVEQFQSDVVAVHARHRYPSSGVHWRPGIIVTADHTIRQDEDIQVTLADGKTVPATLGGRDAGSDIAFLKVEGIGAPANPSGDAEAAKVGELAMVLGRSPDSGPNASLGVISAVSGPWRTWRGGRLEQYIRLDATLFPIPPAEPLSIAGGKYWESPPRRFPASPGWPSPMPQSIEFWMP